MNAEQFKHEKQFNAAMALANEMLAKGLLTVEEHGKIREMFVQKYRPLLGGL